MWQRAVSAAVTCAVLAAMPSMAAPPSAADIIRLPGANAFDADLQSRLRQAWQASKGKPRTAHLNPDGSPTYINRLVFASSPYLQQHAYNPVNWYPWGDEAFAAAQREHKPIFLSIGHSTCHGCHVMERECFENEAIAALLNQHFIAIKADREERPDVDTVYVAAVQRLTGSGGWPLTVFLTPDRKPFYGGTYFPPTDQPGRPGLPTLLNTIADTWANNRDSALQAGAGLAESLQHGVGAGAQANLNADTLRKAVQQMAQAFDATNGGFGRAPKFPQAHMLQFLLRYWQRSGEAPAKQMAEETLEHMARGGIRDQLGGGFHRYATDAQWLVPHFEKMLYDQAVDARAYLEAQRASHIERFGLIAREIFTYVLRDLTSPSGGFYAAEDADSDGGEGRFYLWTRAEIIAALGAEHGPLAADFYGMTDNAGPRPLSIPVALDAFAKQQGGEAAQLVRTLTDARSLLLEARSKRPRPLRDEKVITAWNGLMISSLAYGSTVLGEPQDAAAAARAADFILTRLQRDGRLLHSFRDTPSAVPGYLDDYGCFILGLNDLYAATFDVRWLREAKRLSADMLRLFADPSNGGLRYTAGDHEQLIAPAESLDDAALPSAQSVAALALLQLGRLTMTDAFESAGRAVLAANSDDVSKSPTAHTYLLMALDFSLGPTKEIVIAGPPDADDTKALLTIVRKHYLPRSVLVLHPPKDSAIESLVPFVKKQVMINDKPTAYVCENYVCKLPVSDPKKLEALLVERRFRAGEQQ